jgi:putative ABC transport system ATP-binding protein
LPTGSLDSITSEEILQLFKDLNREQRTIVVVTHAADVAQCAERRITLHDGKIVHEERQAGVRPLPLRRNAR